MTPRALRLPAAAVLLAACTAFLAWADPAAPDAPEPRRKFLIERGAARAERLRSHGTSLARYGAFDVLEIHDAELARLSAADREAIVLRPDLDRLELKAGAFDTRLRSAPEALPARWREPAGARGTRLYLVQFVGPLKDEWLDLLRKLGASPVHAIPVHGLLVRATERAIAELRGLAAERRILQYAGPYHPYYRVAPGLMRRLEAAHEPDGLVTVSVQRHVPESRDAEARTADAAAALAEEVLVGWWPVPGYENARLRLRLDRLYELARQPDVVWIREWVEPTLNDEVQARILTAHLDAESQGPTGPGYLQWLIDRGFSAEPAAYPVVVVTDDGIGNGTVDTGDPTLHVAGDASKPTRVEFNKDCTGDGAHGLDGHGHINASIAGGHDTRAGAPFQDADGYQRGLGVNPFGRLAGLRIFGNDGFYDLARCNNTEQGVISLSYRSGARISTNSWGAPVGGDYEESAQAYDFGTRDAARFTEGNQEMLFVFSAGNEGPAAGSIGTPGTAKNVLTVGASENARPDGFDRCAVGPDGADDAMDVIDFSSRGPAEGNRVKPELIAPGTHVQGTASSFARYTGNGVCDQYWPSGQTVYARSSGTSHSTPAVAGAASLAYHWLQFALLGGAAPSPALVKAYLMAHTTTLTGEAAGTDLPSATQGYGMPDLDRAFEPTRRILVNQSHLFDHSGETFLIEGAIDDPQLPFKAVLVWTDAPGSLSGAPQVNDLDLEVRLDGVLYRGNRFSGPWSTPDGSPDTRNNYEVVSLPPGSSGLLDVTVVARNVAGDGVPNTGDATDQDFALVVYNATEEPGFRLAFEQASTAVCGSGSVQVPVSLRSIKGFSEPVALSTGALPDGVSASFSAPAVSPPGTAVLTVNVVPGTKIGSYAIDIVGSSGTLLQVGTLELQVQALPYAPLLQQPLSGGGTVDPAAALVWFPIAGTETYRVQVATEPSFASPVVDESTVAAQWTPPDGGLQPGTTYHWRVQARNSCGESAFSATQSFTTALVASLSVPCTGLPQTIPDNDSGGVTCTMSVPEGFVVKDLTLDVQITHPWRGDLRLDLTSPQGTIVRLREADINDSADDIVGNFDQSLTPTGPGTMSDFDGENGGGVWTFQVIDNFGEDVGRLQQVRLNLTGFVPQAPPVPVAGWLGGALATALAGWLCQRSARRQR